MERNVPLCCAVTSNLSDLDARLLLVVLVIGVISLALKEPNSSLEVVMLINLSSSAHLVPLIVALGNVEDGEETNSFLSLAVLITTTIKQIQTALCFF